MNNPWAWAALAILAIVLLCAHHPSRWRSILSDAALWVITLITVCAPLLIRS